MRFDLFSSGRLYKALKEANYPDLPAERTLRDWIKNDSAPQGARLAVAKLLDMDTTKAAAPPDWAERLEAKVDQLVIAAIASPKQREVVRRLARRLGVLPKPSAEGFDDLPDTGDPDAITPGGQGSS